MELKKLRHTCKLLKLCPILSEAFCSLRLLLLWEHHCHG